jgi:hypothetical protein
VASLVGQLQENVAVQRGREHDDDRVRMRFADEPDQERRISLSVKVIVHDIQIVTQVQGWLVRQTDARVWPHFHQLVPDQPL